MTTDQMVALLLIVQYEPVDLKINKFNNSEQKPKFIIEVTYSEYPNRSPRVYLSAHTYNISLLNKNDIRNMHVCTRQGTT